MNKEYEEKLRTLQGIDFCKCLNEYIKHNEKIEQENKQLKKKYENAVADYETIMSELQELKKQLEEINKMIDKATNELFILKDMIYKPETREENFEIQRKISLIIKRLNGIEVSE